MIGADTNLLARHFLEDEPAQSAIVHALFDQERRRQRSIHVSHVVLCELCWVMRRVYGLQRHDIAGVVRALLEDSLFALDQPSEVGKAVRQFETLGGDFADHLIGVLGGSSGATTTYTFDKKAAKLPGFTLLGATLK